MVLFSRSDEGIGRLATILKGRSRRADNTGYARRMSSHLAAALMISCLLQILIVAKMGGSLVLHLCLIVAIGALAVFARMTERRWELLDQHGLGGGEMDRRFRRDKAQFWFASIATGLVWIPITAVFHFLIG